MEKVCEFCKAFKPVVYCEADAANLCLSCDAKVHSANALSNRHLRTLLCDSCRYHPCSVRCLDHRMFVCHGCDSNFHGVSSQHQRRVVSCYTGCPSAKDFAVMWGLQSSNNAVSQYSFSLAKSKARRRLDAGSSSQQDKGEFQRDNGFILQQILELEKLQLSEENGSLLLMRQADVSNLVTNAVEDLDKRSTQVLQQSEGRPSDPLQTKRGLMVDFSPSPFPQEEHLSSSSSTIADSLWECRSPSENNQLWYQNMQDIGVCEDTVCRDDFDIPDVDLTFRNYEELFKADQEPTAEAASAAASFYADPCAQTKRDPSPFNGSHESKEDSLPAVALACSSLSFSLSGFSNETSGTDSHDGQSSPVAAEEVSCWSPRASNLHLGGRENTMSRLKEKKKIRSDEKQSQYVPRKARKETRKHVNHRFAIAESF